MIEASIVATAALDLEAACWRQSFAATIAEMQTLRDVTVVSPPLYQSL
jgi:hypothetical protein